MLGAIAGDIVGSPYEGRPIKTKRFPLFGDGSSFTDDTVCTLAIADALMSGGDFAASLRAFARRFPDAGYGSRFGAWFRSDQAGPYNSLGNGSAMRVSPVAHVARSRAEVLSLAERTARVTHNHPAGVAGAQATALAIWLARQGETPDAIRTAITDGFGYDLSTPVDRLRASFGYDVTCAGTVPPALTCALEARDFEDALRNAVSLGGDADTLACIAGGLAEALFGVPRVIARQALGYLPEDLRATLRRFDRHCAGGSRLGIFGRRLWRTKE